MIYEGFDIDSFMEYDADLLISTIHRNNAKIGLYGCGIQSRTIISIFEALKISNLICLYDNNQSKIGSNFCGYHVYDASSLNRLENQIVFLTCSFPAQVFKDLESRHALFSSYPIYNIFKYLLDDNSLHSEGLNYQRSLLDIEREFQFYQNEILNLASKLQDHFLHLKSVDAVVTEGCSLKCIDCSNLMQYYVKPKSSNLDILIQSTQKILLSVDRVLEWRILGGEPFIYKPLPQYLDYLSECKNIGSIIVYTNGTILPSVELISSLKNSKSIVEISNYGAASRHAIQLKEILVENNITCTLKDPIWTDSGRIHTHKNESKDELSEKYFRCCTNDILTLLHGKIYHCPFSANLINLDSKYFSEDDVVDIATYNSVDDLRIKLSTFYKGKQYLHSCNYCNGRDYTVPLVPTAVQTRKPLSMPN